MGNTITRGANRLAYPGYQVIGYSDIRSTLRLPDEAQAGALRLLDVSREVVNAVITSLWPRLDEFGTRETKYAYKQVEEMIVPPVAHGHRQWRCEAEQAGRIIRGQAERKKQFALLLPILEQGMIQPKTEAKR